MIACILHLGDDENDENDEVDENVVTSEAVYQFHHVHQIRC